MGKFFGIEAVPIPATPIPLPVRYRIYYGDPINVQDRYSPSDSDNPEILKQVALEVRDAVDQLVQRGLKERKRGVFMMKRNVLITGASSPIGKELVQRLLEDSRIGRVIAVFDPQKKIHLPEHPRLTVVTVDIRKQRRLHSLLFGITKEQSINVIVHTSQTESATRKEPPFMLIMLKP